MTNTVSVFIPIYNEEAILEKNALLLSDYLNSKHLAYEIIIGSNGSTDRSASLGKNLASTRPDILFFHLPEKGAGSAMRQALSLARFENFLTLDMDLSTDMSFIELALEKLARYDIVVGSKIAGSQERPWIRKAGSAVFVRCAKWLLKLDIADYSIGAKAFKTDVLKKYADQIDTYTAYVLQILFKAQKDGLKITEVGVKCVDTRESRFNLLHEGIYKFYTLFKIWLAG